METKAEISKSATDGAEDNSLAEKRSNCTLVEVTASAADEQTGDSRSRIVPWSTLPEELLQNIIARLPLPSLINLHQFAQNPNCNTNLDDSVFRRLCARIHTKMVGLIVPIKLGSMPRGIEGFHSVGVHDTKSSTWQIIELSVARFGHRDSTPAYSSTPIMTSCDGGLVSLAQLTTFPIHDGGTYHLVVLVVNPLTGDYKELPPPSMVLLKTMQLAMDRDTRRYKLTLVGRTRTYSQSATLVAECYDSRTGKWTIMDSSKSPDVVVGLQYHWSTAYSRSIIGFEETHRGATYGAYDCARGQLVEFGSIQPGGGRRGARYPEPYVFVDDRAFVLHATRYDPGVYHIGEYRCPTDGSSQTWVKLKDHRFDPYPRDKRPDMPHDVKFWGCRGFLLVVEDVHFVEHGAQSQQVAWLYELSTGAWTDFPELRDGRKHLSSTTSVMCELQWDAVP